jgi:XTP/dITP diphosphohydrolase
LLGEGWEVTDLKSYPEWPVPVEDGVSFEENAGIKAMAASERLGAGVLVVADDSGLEVDALGGRPGIFSARYAGEGASEAENREKLMGEMTGVPMERRAARFRCVLAVARVGEVVACFSGSVEGQIAEQATGQGGFGYDPIFVPVGYEKSFGELSLEVKNTLSHRARALEKLLAWAKDVDLTKG